MSKAVGTIFIMSAVLAGFTAFTCLAALPGAVRNAAREPEDVALLAFWLAITASLAVLWFVGAVQVLGHFRRRSRGVELVGAAAMFLLGCMITIGGAASSVDRFLIAPGLLILGSAVAYTWLGRREHGPANTALQPTPPSRRG